MTNLIALNYYIKYFTKFKFQVENLQKIEWQEMNLQACSKRHQQLNFVIICPNIGFKPNPTKKYAFWFEI